MTRVSAAALLADIAASGAAAANATATATALPRPIMAKTKA